MITRRSGAAGSGRQLRQAPDHTHRDPRIFLLLQNAEIFTLTYGSMVRQLIADCEDVEEVNKQLEKM